MGRRGRHEPTRVAVEPARPDHQERADAHPSGSFWLPAQVPKVPEPSGLLALTPSRRAS